VQFNRGIPPADIFVAWENLGYPGHLRAAVYDLWRCKYSGKFEIRFSAKVPPHDVVVIKVEPWQIGIINLAHTNPVNQAPPMLAA